MQIICKSAIYNLQYTNDKLDKLLREKIISLPQFQHCESEEPPFSRGSDASGEKQSLTKNLGQSPT